MNIHEYQAKELMRKHGIATLSRGGVAFSVDEALSAVKELGEVFGLLKLKFMQVDEVKLVALRSPS